PISGCLGVVTPFTIPRHTPFEPRMAHAQVGAFVEFAVGADHGPGRVTGEDHRYRRLGRRLPDEPQFPPEVLQQAQQGLLRGIEPFAHPLWIDRLRVATFWRVHGDLRQLPPRNAHNAETVGGQDAATVVLDEARAAALFRQAFTSSGTM